MSDEIDMLYSGLIGPIFFASNGKSSFFDIFSGEHYVFLVYSCLVSILVVFNYSFVAKQLLLVNRILFVFIIYRIKYFKII